MNESGTVIEEWEGMEITLIYEKEMDFVNSWTAKKIYNRKIWAGLFYRTF